VKRLLSHLTAWALILTTLGGSAQTSNLKSDEQVVFYPTSAWQSTDGKWWHVEIHGCVYEYESRGLALAILRKGLALGDVEMTRAQRAVFAERARLFMVDNQRGKQVVIRLGQQTHVLDRSEANGHFSTMLRLSPEEVSKLEQGTGEHVAFEAVMSPGDTRRFGGLIRFLRPEGWAVISDIDDTIKITEVTDSSATVRNTFLEPFRPVPGMARLYSTWERANAGFFYVSASPWQLYLPLSEFARTNGFPAGCFQMKLFRLKDGSRSHVLEDPEQYKPGVIEAILKRFPNRRFVLVGDSGERDPEIYAAQARRHPRQVARILIRNVTQQNADAPRYRQTFRDLPRDLWEVFEDPAAVTDDKATR
jgi:hypothetical protein